MNEIVRFCLGLTAGFWGFLKIPENPGNGSITLLIGGLLVISAIGKMLRASRTQDLPPA